MVLIINQAVPSCIGFSKSTALRLTQPAIRCIAGLTPGRDREPPLMLLAACCLLGMGSERGETLYPSLVDPKLWAKAPIPQFSSTSAAYHISSISSSAAAAHSSPQSSLTPGGSDASLTDTAAGPARRHTPLLPPTRAACLCCQPSSGAACQRKLQQQQQQQHCITLPVLLTLHFLAVRQAGGRRLLPRADACHHHPMCAQGREGGADR